MPKKHIETTMSADRPQLMERWRIRRHTGTDQMRAEVSHRRKVEALKWLLPTTALALTSVIAWFWLNPSTTAFHLSYSLKDFELSGQDEMLNPRFLGVDNQKQRYTVTAEAAMRSAAGNEQVFLIKPAADITVEKGEWLALNADQGIYDRSTETLTLSGAVSLYADNGLEMHTDSAQVDLTSGVIESNSAVRGQGPWGLLNANGFKYAREDDILHFYGRPTLVLYPDLTDAAP